MNEIENQLDKSIKALGTDRWHKYLSKQFEELCVEKGIIRQSTTPYTPQQNGLAKRRNKTLLDMTRSMMEQTTLSISF